MEEKPSPDVAPEMLSREQGIAAISETYIQALKALGVTSLVIGVPLSEDPKGQGLMNCFGKSSIVLNLLAGLIHTLQPQDFENLLEEMKIGVYFRELRISASMLRLPEGKPN